MTDLEKRYILKEYNKMLRQEKEIALCYRGTSYKKYVLKWSGDSVGGSIPPFTISLFSPYEDTWLANTFVQLNIFYA